MWRAFVAAIFGIRSESAVLPRQGTTGASLAIVMTIMSFLACLAVWATISIATATQTWTSGIANTVTVQIKPGPDGPVPQAAIDGALAVLSKTPGIADARALSTKDTAKLLQPWLGSNVLGPELPLPVLIDVTLKHRSQVDFPKLDRALKAAAPGAVLDDHTRWTARLMSVSHSLTAVSLTVLALVLFAAAAIVVFATRAGLVAHHGIVEILHLSGAQGNFIAAEFERHFMRLGLRAGVMGLILAVATLLIVYVTNGPATDPGGIPLVPHLAMAPIAFIGLIAVPLGAGMVATLTARITVLRALAAMP
jgi:cell division transport system permease protein